MLSLENMVIINTQPADQASELSSILKAKGAKVFNVPMIETYTLTLTPEQIDDCLTPNKYSHIIFTSKKGVRGFFENIINCRGSTSLPESLKIAVIGDSTREEVEKYGHKVDFVNPGTNLKAFVPYLLENVVNYNDNVILALGMLAPDNLSKALSGKTNPLRLNVYKTIAVKEVDEQLSEYITSGRADMCVFTSPSAYYNFVEFFGIPKDISFAAIGTTTAEAIEQSGGSVQMTAPYPSAEALAAEIEKYFINHKI